MRQPSTPPSPALRRLRTPRHLPLLGAVLFLAGCAQLPDLGASPQPKSADAFQSARSLTAPLAQWPAQQWWTAYGDTQLDALIAEALADAPDLAAAAARLQRADAVVQIAGAANRPQLSANASISEDKLSYNHLTPRAMTPSGMNDYGRATLNLQWELDFWGKNRSALAAATSDVHASQAELAQARLWLASGVAAHYAELSRLYANRDTADKAVAIRAKTAGLFSERLDNGLENRGGLHNAQARLAMAEGELLALDEQIALQRNRLAALLGAGPDRGLTITRPSLKLDRAFGLPAELSADLLGRRPDVVAARWRAEAQSRRIDQQKAEFYPNVNLSALVGVQSLGLDILTKGGSGIAGIGPAISLPIFSGGRLQGALRGAHAAYGEAVAAYNTTVARALQDVADNAISQKALGERLLKVQQAVDAASQAHRVANNRYEGGLATYLEVLTAEDALLGALSAQTNLHSASFTLDIGLQRALGGGYQQPDVIAKK
ncbi:NodT family efflux transporter outer membrane factor (OMF) lipoprotein [Acidovorax sp. 69]|uniref:efflux transporter outer membrane subunit n=1 Tax=Acidovorax sp. 69 TaxID=2035202 RepID=UPI000C243E07|nr:efflux transporter outer membrane subunit [Acidovorax sp. 69]PJI99123.1 NodT family efflux transporter outer membrane factor (OMF) lipoprotein [Acidovorax sp. 69]